jgi:hypothetical protein
MQLQPRSGIELTDPTYPDSKILYLEAIQERVPVFEGKFRITQDATVIPSEALDVARSLVGTQKTISITGELRYQACDKAICYPPASVPLKWELQILPLDLKRSPKGIRHK